MADSFRKIGVILTNVGTPDAPETPQVRNYLRQFLSDPRVLDIHPVARWLLLNLVILPRRPAESAAAYRKIWGQDGSPLLSHSRALAAAAQQQLGDDFLVLPAMRYGNPSIPDVLESLRAWGADRLVVFPQYPQFASSSTGTSLEEVYRCVGRLWNVASLAVVPPFYDDPGFIAAFAAVGSTLLDELRPDHVLFSFHGLPERHVRKSDRSGTHCLQSADCCKSIVSANQNCYRAQCFATARLIAESLSLATEGWSVTFQSRLGRDPWIQPYTDEAIVQLARGGTKRLAVFCPAFVADCLETLEEIGMRAHEDFTENGGADLKLVPSLNATPPWVDTVVGMIRRAASSFP